MLLIVLLFLYIITAHLDVTRIINNLACHYQKQHWHHHSWVFLTFSHWEVFIISSSLSLSLPFLCFSLAPFSLLSMLLFSILGAKSINSSICYLQGSFPSSPRPVDIQLYLSQGGETCISPKWFPSQQGL